MNGSQCAYKIVGNRVNSNSSVEEILASILVVMREIPHEHEYIWDNLFDHLQLLRVKQEKGCLNEKQENKTD